MSVYVDQAKAKMLKFIGGVGTGSIHITSFVVGTAPLYTPTHDQTALRNPILAKDITMYEIIRPHEDIQSYILRYTCQLEISECVGQNITELGLVDADGDLVCVKTFRAKEKTGNADMTFIVDDIFESELVLSDSTNA